MATLEIDGIGRVDVDDAFLSLSPEQQGQEVDYIASVLRGGASDPAKPAGAPAPPVYGPNDQVLQPQTPTTPEPRGIATRAVEGAKAGFGDGELGMSTKTRAENPAASSLQVLAAPADGLLRLISAAVGGGTGALAGLAEKAGLSPADADRLQRDLGMIAQVAAVEVPTSTGASAVRASTAADQAAMTTTRAPIKAVPATTAEMRTVARDFYKQAEDAGVVVKPESFRTVVDDLVTTAQKSGLDVTLTPDSVAALKRIQDAADGPITFQNLDLLRQIASDAQGAVRKSDQRIAGILVDKLDDYVGKLAAKDVATGDPRVAAETIVKARDLWSRSAKLDTISKLVDRAEISAPNFSGSGMENALRTEFRALAKNERKMRTFTPQEQNAIKKVARGGVLENTARAGGKLAPTGIVPFALGGGVGAAAGTALGIGPFAGATAAQAIGFGARQLATKLTLRNVKQMEDLVRSGGATPSANRALKRARSILNSLKEMPESATARTAVTGATRRENDDGEE